MLNNGGRDATIARSNEFEKMRYAFPNGAGHVSGCCTSELIKRKFAGCGELSMQCAINERTGNCVLSENIAVSQWVSEERKN